MTKFVKIKGRKKPNEEKKQHLHIHKNKVFVNGPVDLGSIPGRIIPKTFKKWYLIPPCLTLSNIRYVSRVK